MNLYIKAFLMLAVIAFAPLPVKAQPQPSNAPDTQSGVVNNMGVAEASPVEAADPVERATLLAIADAKGRLRDASVTPESMQTLFFTAWQHALLQEAKIGFNTRLPNPGEVGQSSDPNAPREPGIRELALGGISYGSASKWAVWLNGVRITPDAIPEQVLDIKVGKAHIDLKWYDSYTNKIYPVRLRPHERFNLDSRIFLPGAQAGAM